MDDKQKFERARRRVEALKAFYVHIAVFVVVMLILIIIDLANGGPKWVHWPLLGWGLAIAGHAALAFGRMPKMIGEWEKRKLREYMHDDK
jgi:Na+/melibiose symporter-like transporter